MPTENAARDVQAEIAATQLRESRIRELPINARDFVATIAKTLRRAMAKTQIVKMNAEHDMGVEPGTVESVAHGLREALYSVESFGSAVASAFQEPSEDQVRGWRLARDEVACKAAGSSAADPESGTLPVSRMVENEVDPKVGDRIASAKSALANALKAIDDATLHGQDAESVADGEDIPSPGAFGKIYGALRVARENVRGAAVDLDELGDVAKACFPLTVG